MKIYETIYVPGLKKRFRVNKKTINGEELEFGNIEQAKVVKYLETHNTKIIRIPEQADIKNLNARTETMGIIATNEHEVTYSWIGYKGNIIEKTVKRAYFIKKYT